MISLLWFSGIGWDTKMKEIGWVYVFLLGMIIILIKLVKDLIKEWNRDEW